MRFFTPTFALFAGLTAATTLDNKTPHDDAFAVHVLAVGDWGATLDGHSSVKEFKKDAPHDAEYYRNLYAQRNVAYLMGTSAKRLKPAAVLGHGDSFYDDGLNRDDTDARFQATFEQVYNHQALQNVPWFNVMGNHGYGGAHFICDGECKSTEELLKNLEAKFQRQQTYKSPNKNRWTLKDHYYKESLVDEKSGVTVDVFNVDTNAGTRKEPICCQCKGYDKKMKANGQKSPGCRKVKRGDALCAGGSTEMFDACVNRMQQWEDDSLKKFIRDANTSKATWKVVHSHYAPHHHFRNATAKDAWVQAVKDSGAQLFINGHCHAEAHEYADFKTHFITNGAGGGSQAEPMEPLSPNETAFHRVWESKEGAYGFFELSFGPKQMRAQFVTFGDDWVFGNGTATKQGSSQVGHCHLIPVDGGKGTSCGSDQKSSATKPSASQNDTAQAKPSC